MRFIIATPTKEILEKVIAIFGREIYNIYLFESNIPITHIDFKFTIQDITFYSIAIKEFEYEFILGIQTVDQLVQVLSFITLGMEFTDLKLFLENQNAI